MPNTGALAHLYALVDKGRLMGKIFRGRLVKRHAETVVRPWARAYLNCCNTESTCKPSSPWCVAAEVTEGFQEVQIISEVVRLFILKRTGLGTIRDPESGLSIKLSEDRERSLFFFLLVVKHCLSFGLPSTISFGPLKRMKPRHENMRLDAARELTTCYRNIGSCLCR